MELEQEELLEPVSPCGQYLKSSVLSLTIIAVMELEIPLDHSLAIQLLKDLFLPINPRFSSIMITGKNGEKKWKSVEVDVHEHAKFPKFHQGKSPDYYEECLSNYISKLGIDQFPTDRPFWEVHVINYPTRNAAANVVFKIHHALGDGYSLVGALLSCLNREDNPNLPLTFPSGHSTTKLNKRKATCKATRILKLVPQVTSRVFNTLYDFGIGVLKSTLIQDDCSPIRSGEVGMEFRPLAITTMAFSIDQFKQIKAKLGVTINDLITGIIMYGARLYMKQANHGHASMEKTTMLVLLNTRALVGYKSISEMTKPNAETPWGNRFAFLSLSVPHLIGNNSKSSTPLSFVSHAHRIIKRQRNSASVYFTGKLLEAIRRAKGPEATAKYILGTIKNSSMGISNLIGPMEKMALARHPVKGIYFAVAGSSHSLQFSVMSYVGTLRICIGTQKDFIDPFKLKSCINNAFESIFESALQPSSPSRM